MNNKEDQTDILIKNILIELVKKSYLGEYYLPPKSTKMCVIPMIDMGNGNQCYHKTIIQNEQKEVYECKPAPTLEEMKNADSN